jgi:ABC-2 type transport system permease protein
MDVRRYLELTLTLAVNDFKLRYYGNALGYFWTLARPLLTFAVIYVAFTEILEVGNTIAHFPSMLVCGIVLYSFFAEATGGAVGSLVTSGNLIRKIPVPALAVPLAVVLQAFFTLCLNLIAVGFFFAIDGVPVTSDWLQAPLILGGLLLITIAFSSLLANMFVPFRDTGQIWEVLLQMFFWGSAILYEIQSIPEGIRHVIMFNPLAVVMVQMHHSIIDQSQPSALGAAGAGRLAVSALIVVAVFVSGALMYQRVRPRLAEQV